MKIVETKILLMRYDETDGLSGNAGKVSFYQNNKNLPKKIDETMIIYKNSKKSYEWLEILEKSLFLSKEFVIKKMWRICKNKKNWWNNKFHEM